MDSIIKELILEFTLGKISKADFEQNDNIQIRDNARFFLELLNTAITEKDKDAVEYILMIAGVFDSIEEYLPVLRQLIEEKWHNQHENIIDILSHSVDELNAISFYNVLNSIYEYHQDAIEDFMVPIWVKCVWALGKVGNDESRKYLSEFKNSKYLEVREAVVKQFERNRWS